VLHGLRPVLGVEQRLDDGEIDPALGGHLTEGRGPGLARHLGDAVHLDAITGGEDHHLRAGASSHQAGKDLAQLVLVDHELLPHRDGRGAVRETGHE